MRTLEEEILHGVIFSANKHGHDEEEEVERYLGRMSRREFLHEISEALEEVLRQRMSEKQA